MTSGRNTVERFLHAMKGPIDWETVQELQHPDYVEEWPQSGERTRGRENFRAILENWPGGISDESLATERIVGAEDQWAVSAPVFGFMSPIRIVGTGDVYTWEGEVRYPKGEVWKIVGIVELREGKIAKTTQYFAPPFEPPEWRSRWVEKM